MRKRPLFERPKHQRRTTNTKTPQATAFRSRPRKGEAAPPAPKPKPPGAWRRRREIERYWDREEAFAGARPSRKT
jgi:hypothetical protein